MALVREHRPAALVMEALCYALAFQLIMFLPFGLITASPSHTRGCSGKTHLLLQVFLDLAPRGSAGVQNLQSSG